MISNFPDYYAQINTSKIKPFFALPKPLPLKTQRIAVIGAGLAGCAMTYKLAQHGFNIDLYDKSEDIALGASGNQQGMLKPYLTVDMNASDLFHTRGFLETHNFLKAYAGDDVYTACGALHILSEHKEQNRYHRLFQQRTNLSDLACLVAPQDASKIAGVTVNHEAVYFREASAVSPSKLCQLWLRLADSRVRLVLNQSVSTLAQDQKGLWTINHGGACYDAVIMCAGYEGFKAVDQVSDLPVYPAQGQVSYAELKGVSPNCILAEKGYVIPNFINGSKVTIGATYRHNDDLKGDIRVSDHDENKRHLNQIIPNLDLRIVDGRVGTRCVTSDHLPIVGAVPSYHQFEGDYQQKLKKGATFNQLSGCPYYQGLYVSSGFGSKGLCSALLSANIITSILLGEQLSINASTYQALHPARFWVKQFRKN